MKVGWCVLALLPLAACGADGSAGSSTTTAASTPASSASATPVGVVTVSAMPTPSPPPTFTGPRSLYEIDTDATVVLHPGESVRVSLGPQYVVPTVEGSAVTRTAADGGYPTGRDVEAMFAGQRAGRADLVSYTDYPCLHVEPRCMLPQMTWRVHIVVR